MISSGVKTEASDKRVTSMYVENHLNIGIESLLEIKNNGQSVKHLKF
jgi:AMP nucleosidase